ncbi:MAG TPA: sugar phosphate isomerase/epimerase family protein [Planctomycetaceae bacterium]|nr:sugar phosphate isomerase/epimerase family protein [Planctomycetaceae bacterium]
MLNRREFLEIGSAGALSLAAAATASRGNWSPSRRFSRNYAPQLGMFRHHAGSEPLDQIRFLADDGFRSIEDTGLRAKRPALQRQIGRELTRRGMSLACFTGIVDFGRATFASGRPDLRLEVMRQLQFATEVADRVGGRALSVVPGQRDASLDLREQRRNAIELVSQCSDLCARRGIVLLLEPIDHGVGSSRLFLRSARQAAALCRVVKTPSCRLLIDVSQQAMAGEDVPKLLEDVSDVLGHVQLGNVAGWKKRGTAIEIPRLLATLDAIGYRGALGLDCGAALAGKARERDVIAACVDLDRSGQGRMA